MRNVLGALILMLAGCASSGFYNMSDSWCESHPGASENRCPGNTHKHLSASQSWDQENLKKNDHGCPTAIYVAPDGVLQQCP